MDDYRCQVTIFWRDDSQSVQEVMRHNQRGRYWTPDKLTVLRQLVEGDSDQVAILRTFPGNRWGAIQDRYGYHFNNSRWRKAYKGKTSYPLKARWEDTAEYEEGQKTEVEGSTA